ncbi:VOC family protein [Intrasporangium calvum]|uniref:VOC family protein n=1 Tax=Intrasporangium calvum TaxID=53358 RepID=A0ABT5GF39_9MICO|nr:VOC family protein [Intrasporangium calvum]MDC5696506.1 VOC family protein [Intrasporangium calvum]
MIRELAYLGVGSPRYEEWLTYGTTVLGCALAARGEDGAVRLRVDDAVHRITVRPGEQDELLYTGWAFTSEVELAAYVDRLRLGGIEVTQGTAEECRDRGVAVMSWVTDPWGARLEFVAGQHRRPGTFWPGRQLSGFVADDFGLGHVVLIVPDLAAADAFYADVLGFTLSDRVDEEHMKVRFYHCNGRHHSLAVAQVPGKVGFNHLMLEVKSLDDVGTGLDLARAAGVPVLRGLGRHTNDLMTSFYMATPSSFQIEYGHGGIIVDDLTWIAATNDRPSLWGHELTEAGRATPPGILHDVEAVLA